MTKPDGGPAFPRTLDMNDRVIRQIAGRSAQSTDGMSLRDYFAAKAMPQMIHASFNRTPISAAGVAKASYELADAMIAERDKE